MTAKLAYCDYIADRIHRSVSNEIGDNDTLMATWSLLKKHQCWIKETLQIGKKEVDIRSTRVYNIYILNNKGEGLLYDK